MEAIDTKGNTSGMINITCNSTSIDPPTAKYIVFYMLLYAMSFCTLIGNGIIVHVYRSVKKARSQRNFFIFVLALTDLCIVPIVPVMSSMYLIRRYVGDNRYLQVINYAVYITSLGASTVSLFFLSFDRFLAVMSPLKHRRVALGDRPCLVIGSVWIIPITFGLIVPLAWHNRYDPNSCDKDWDLLNILKLEYFKFILFPIFTMITLLIALFYVAIFIQARKQRYWRQGFDQSNSSSSQKETKMVITALLIIGLFYFCWLPFILTTAVQVWNKTLRDTEFISHLRAFFGILPLINSTVNPIIYAFRIPVFKKHAKEILSCVYKPNSSDGMNNTGSTTATE